MPTSPAGKVGLLIDIWQVLTHLDLQFNTAKEFEAGQTHLQYCWVVDGKLLPCAELQGAVAIAAKANATILPDHTHGSDLQQAAVSEDLSQQPLAARGSGSDHTP